MSGLCRDWNSSVGGVSFACNPQKRQEARAGKRRSPLWDTEFLSGGQSIYVGAMMSLKEVCLSRVPSILVLGLVYVTYVLIGGVVFWKLEGGHGQKDMGLLLQSKERLLTTYTCLNQEGLEAVAQVRPVGGNGSINSNTGDWVTDFTALHFSYATDNQICKCEGSVSQ